MIHEDLVPIQRFWANIETTTQLQQERGALTRDGEHAVAAVNETEAGLARVTAELQTHRVEEQRILQSLKMWQQRRDSTRRMMDEGRAPDFLLAQRQLDGCVSNVDDLETQALDRMEAIETAIKAIARLDRELGERRTRLEHVLHSQSVGLPRIEQALESLQVERARLEKEIPTAWREQIRQLQRMNRSLVAPLRDGACTACNCTVAPQMLIEINRGARAHVCRYCARFLIPEE